MISDASGNTDGASQPSLLQVVFTLNPAFPYTFEMAFPAALAACWEGGRGGGVRFPHSAAFHALIQSPLHRYGPRGIICVNIQCLRE